MSDKELEQDLNATAGADATPDEKVDVAEVVVEQDSVDKPVDDSKASEAESVESTNEPEVTEPDDELKPLADEKNEKSDGKKSKPKKITSGDPKKSGMAIAKSLFGKATKFTQEVYKDSTLEAHAFAQRRFLGDVAKVTLVVDEANFEEARQATEKYGDEVEVFVAGTQPAKGILLSMVADKKSPKTAAMHTVSTFDELDAVVNATSTFYKAMSELTA
ncbi:hypothetical protein V6259_12980 [Marinomonas sp. TI.3.20]|uniref:hypothetical protein n=1 Tax=Marinomonas sp. TI.3.20 TaxID=3121296 RepID=UPI00311E0AF2